MKTGLIEKCTAALTQIQKYYEQFPGEPALASVTNQLQYIIRLERGEETDRARLTQLTLGHHAVYALSNIISDDLSKLLCEISDDVRRRLRRDLHARGELKDK